MNRLAEIEVLLFVAGEDGLTLRNLAEMLEMQPTAVSQQLEKLGEKYMADKASGLAILESSNRYKLVTKKEYANLLRIYAKTPINQTMSRALLETLSIVAYKQPITRIEVDDIRGSIPAVPSVSCRPLTSFVRTVRKRCLVDQISM